MSTPAWGSAEATGSFKKIDVALERGELSSDEALEQRLSQIFAPSSMRPELRPDSPNMLSGAPIFSSNFNSAARR
jgi:hypothetical protein